MLILSPSQGQSYTASGNYRVFPIDSMGVVLFSTELREVESTDFQLTITRLDTDLKEVWTNSFPFTKGLRLALQEIGEEEISLLFTSQNGRYLELIRANTAFGDYTRSRYEFSAAFVPSSITSYFDNFWVAGFINENPVIFNLKEQGRYETLPVGIPGELKAIAGLDYDRKSKALNYVLLGNVDGESVMIWRSLGLDGRLIQNHRSASFESNQAMNVRVIYDEQHAAYVVGTYSKTNRSTVEGFYFSRIATDPDNKFQRLKSINAAISYKRLNRLESGNFDQLKEVKTSKANKLYVLDALSWSPSGQLMVSFEVYGREFRNRGTLEQQIIARDRAAQIDLNTYGRRAFDQTGPDLTERIDQMSATDQLQMRFMDQSLAKAIAEGVYFQHVGVIRFNKLLDIEESYGLFLDLDDQGSYAQAENMIQGELRYAQGNRIKTIDLLKKQFSQHDGPEQSFLIPWQQHVDLIVTFNAAAEQLQLSVLPWD